MTVRQRPLNLKNAIGADEHLPGQRAAPHLNRLLRQAREVPEVLVLDLAVLAEGAAQNPRRVLAILIPRLDCGYVNSATSPLRHGPSIPDKARHGNYSLATSARLDGPKRPQTLRIDRRPTENLRLALRWHRTV